MSDYDNIDWIAQIVPTDPPGTESRSLGDNCMRSIHRSMKNAFPNTTVGDQYTGTLAELSALVAGTGIPTGAIMDWQGDQTAFPDGPDGWTICDGRQRKNGNGNTPDLRGQFIMGAQVDGGQALFVPYVDAAGGSTETDIRDPFSGQLIEFVTEPTTLTESQIGAHSHPMFTSEQVNGTGYDLGSDDLVAGFGALSDSRDAYKMQASGFGNATIGKTGTSGSGAAQGHSHKFTMDGSNTFTGSNYPPYYALLKIQKD